MRSQYAARIEGGKKSGKFVVVSAALAAKILAAPAGRPVTIDGVTYGVLAHVPPAHAAAGETAWRAQHGHADRLWTWDFGAQFHHGGLPRNNPKGNPMRKNPPMLTVAMFHPTTLAGVQRIVPALTADEAVHKLFDKFPPRPGHTIEVRRDGRLIGQWFVAKGAHANPEMIKPAVSATALANMAMYYVVISGKVPPALSTVVRAPSAMLAALEVSKYDDVHPGDIAAVYSMGYGPGGRGGQLIEKYRVRAIHENPITFHGSYKTGTWYVTGEMPRHTGERARGRQMPVYRVSSKADGLALAKRLRAGGARRVDVYSPSGGGSYHLDRDGRLVES